MRSRLWNENAPTSDRQDKEGKRKKEAKRRRLRLFFENRLQNSALRMDESAYFQIRLDLSAYFQVRLDESAYLQDEGGSAHDRRLRKTTGNGTLRTNIGEKSEPPCRRSSFVWINPHTFRFKEDESAYFQISERGKRDSERCFFSAGPRFSAKNPEQDESAYFQFRIGRIRIRSE